MAKRILAVIIGLAIAIGLIALMEKISGKIYPAPARMDFLNPESVKEMMKGMPVGAYLFILFGYIIGSFAGGFVATLIAGKESARSAIIVGAVIFFGGLMNLISLPDQPMWFNITSQLLYIPCAFIGYLFAKRI